MDKKKPKPKPAYTVLQNLRYLMGNFWKWDKKGFLTSSLRLLPLVLLPFLASLLPKAVLDCLETGSSAEKLVLTVLGFTLVIILLQVLDKNVLGRMEGIGMANRLRYFTVLTDKTMDTDYQNLEKPETYVKIEKCMNFLNNDNSGGQAVIPTMLTLLSALAGLLLYSSVLTAVQPLVLLLLAALSAVSLIATRLYQRYVRDNKGIWAKLDNKIWYLVDQGFDFASGKDIRLYRLGKWFQKETKEAQEERLRWRVKEEKRRFAANGVGSLMSFIRDGAAYLYLIIQVLSGGMTAGDFVFYFGIVTGFSSWVSQMITSVSELSRISLECCSLREYLDMPDSFERGEGKPLPAKEEMPCGITFEHVTFQYPGTERPVIEDLCLNVKPGERIALVGVNGAGKTTCMKLLCGLYHPTGGRILVAGRDAAAFNRDAYYNLFTAVFQEFNFLPVSVAQNVSFEAAEKTDLGRVRECLKQADLLEKVEALPNSLDSKMVKSISDDAVDFSGGEQQRLVLARALYKDAPIMILDEPTAALDPIAEDRLYRKYGALTEGKTSFYISHRLSSTRFCDRILYLENGRITEQGTHEELMALGGSYARMFQIQSHYYQKEVAVHD